MTNTDPELDELTKQVYTARNRKYAINGRACYKMFTLP